MRFFPFLAAVGCAAILPATYTNTDAEPQDPEPLIAKMLDVRDITRDDLAPIQASITRKINLGHKDIWLRINSNGGGVGAGLDFIQFLEDHKRAKPGLRVICVVDSRAISMAFIILEAGCDERYATARSLFLAHNASMGQTSGGKLDLDEDSAILEVMNNAMAHLVADRLKISYEDYYRRINTKKSWVFGTQEALKTGAIDRIVKPSELPPADSI